MAQLRLALAQMNSTVGALDANAARIVDMTSNASRKGAHVVAFGEMALTGYPVEDLALRTSFVQASRDTLRTLATTLASAGLADIAVVVGYLDHREGHPDEPQNSVAVIHGGQVIAHQAKHHLPNYGVFDEYRYFVPGNRVNIVRVHGVDIGLAVCEDLWREHGPVAVVREGDADLLLVVNASPYERNKDDTRLELARRRAIDGNATLAYVNIVGGQDELVFDGDSLVVSPTGELIARAPQFEETCLIVDLEVPGREGALLGNTQIQGFTVHRTELPYKATAPYTPQAGSIARPLGDLEEIYTAIVTGLRDYVRKNGFSTVILGLSGGIDSALTGTVAVDALGAERVHGVSMPSMYSSEHSKSDAEELADRTGLQFRTVPIADMVNVFEKHLPLTGLAAENIQARIRGVVLMGISNQEGHLVLANGNKTELAVGYSTIYGDAVGGYAPIKDVPKTLTWELARWRNAVAVERGETPPIPQSSIDKPPSAELRPDQRDSDSLPDYTLLDDILTHYVEHDRSARDLDTAGFDRETVSSVLRMIDHAEYKRRQYPPGPKITSRNFGRDRRLPITNSWREHSSEG